jgi:hypothetical protein
MTRPERILLGRLVLWLVTAFVWSIVIARVALLMLTGE